MKEEGFKNEFPSILCEEFFEKLEGKIFYEEIKSNSMKCFLIVSNSGMLH
jgi:hypothetical protein